MIMTAPVYKDLELLIVVIVSVGAFILIVYWYLELDPTGNLKRASESTKRTLHESIVTSAMADYLYTNMHAVRKDVLHWNSVPIILTKTIDYAVSSKRPFMDLRQFKFQATQACVGDDYRGTLRVVDELFDHVEKTVVDQGLDVSRRFNVIKVCLNILSLIRWSE